MNKNSDVSGGFGESLRVGVKMGKPTVFVVPVSQVHQPEGQLPICEYRVDDGGICGELAESDIQFVVHASLPKARPLRLCKKHFEQLNPKLEQNV